MVEPFTGLIDLEEIDEPSDKSASILNPNKDDNRRLFQVKMLTQK